MTDVAAAMREQVRAACALSFPEAFRCSYPDCGCAVRERESLLTALLDAARAEGAKAAAELVHSKMSDPLYCANGNARILAAKLRDAILVTLVGLDIRARAPVKDGT